MSKHNNQHKKNCEPKWKKYRDAGRNKCGCGDRKHDAPMVVNHGDIHIHVHVAMPPIRQHVPNIGMPKSGNSIGDMMGEFFKDLGMPDPRSMSKPQMYDLNLKMREQALARVERVREDVNDILKRISIGKAEGNNTSELEKEYESKKEFLDRIEEMSRLGDIALAEMKKCIDAENAEKPSKSAEPAAKDAQAAPGTPGTPKVYTSMEDFMKDFKPSGDIKKDLKEAMGVDIDTLPKETSDMLNSLIATLRPQNKPDTDNR